MEREKSASDKILSYNDVVLRRSDLGILSGPYFLNDRIIEFYFSHLATLHSRDDILLVPPSIAFWIKECPDTASLKDFIDPLHLPQKELIIFPINNNDNVERAEGGTHWSLLVFKRDANLFVHHDSSDGFNSVHARRVYRAVFPYTGCEAGYKEWSGTPRQTNGYDCGLYVLAIAREICEWYVSAETKDTEGLWFDGVKEKVKPSRVAEMRSEILELMRRLVLEQ